MVISTPLGKLKLSPFMNRLPYVSAGLSVDVPRVMTGLRTGCVYSSGGAW